MSFFRQKDSSVIREPFRHSEMLKTLQSDRRKLNDHIDSMKIIESDKIKLITLDCKKLSVKATMSQKSFEKRQREKLEMSQVALERHRMELWKELRENVKNEEKSFIEMVRHPTSSLESLNANINKRLTSIPSLSTFYNGGSIP